MAFGTFDLVIDGEQLDGTAETKAKLHLEAQGPGTLRDDAGDQFKFPAKFAKAGGESISLPYTLTLFTDSTSGNSTTIGYEGYVSTGNSGRVSFQFAAPQAGATVQLVDLTDDVVTPISDLQVFRDEAEAAAAAAAASAASVPTEAELSATYATLDKVAPKATVALLGTSVTAQNSPPGGTIESGIPLWDALGYWTWAQINLGHRVTLAAQKGVGGNTTTQMVARFAADILALSPVPGWLLIEPGPNDAANGIASTTTIANLTTMIDQAVDAGMRVILGTVTPSTYHTSTAMKQARSATNRWIKTTAPTLWPGLVVVDWASPLSAAAGGPNTAYFKNEGGTGNYVHPNNQGAGVMGKALSDALGPVASKTDVLLSDPGDPYAISENPFGTGGTGSALPTNWRLASSSGGAYTGTSATEASTDGLAASWGRVTPSAGGARVQPRAATGFAPGDTIYATCEVETDAAAWAGTDVEMHVYAWNTVTPAIVGSVLAVSARTADGANPARVTGVLKTPNFVVPAGANRLDMEMMFKGVGSVRWRRPAIFKVA